MSRMFYCPFCGGVAPTSGGFTADGPTLYRCNHPRCGITFRMAVERSLP